MKYFISIVIYCFGLGMGFYINNIYSQKPQEPMIIYTSKPRDIELYISSDKKKIVVLSAEIEQNKVLKGTIIKGIWQIDPMSSLKIINKSDSDWYKFQLDQGYLGQIGREIISN
jgi:hypothetical protein